jgi:hypothetical protein
MLFARCQLREASSFCTKTSSSPACVRLNTLGPGSKSTVSLKELVVYTFVKSNVDYNIYLGKDKIKTLSENYVRKPLIISVVIYRNFD